VALAFAGGRVLVYSRQPARIFAVQFGIVTGNLSLSSQSAASTGHTLFHLPTQAGIACASCHPEAGEDGHVWQLPEGARRTPTLRGGLKGTAPYHWGGELAGMGSLMSAVMTRRMGGAAQTPARVAAVEDWLDAQPALPAPSDLDREAVARGKALFDGLAACSTCHAGPLGTNNATVSVGTDEVLQVPRLVELARRAPYFHDGRIPTLAARFTPAGGGDRHGNVEGLSRAQVADLIAYLSSR
jgi:mono/diheme cytochrome c family protein